MSWDHQTKPLPIYETCIILAYHKIHFKRCHVLYLFLGVHQVRYHTAPHPGSTNGGISKVRTWAGCGAGKVIVACCQADPYSSSVQVSYQNTKSPFDGTAFPPATTTSGHAYLIPTNCMIHKKKELWKKQFSTSGSSVFITGQRADIVLDIFGH